MASFSEEKKSHEARDDSLESANPRGDRIKRTAKGLKLEPQPSDDPNGMAMNSPLPSQRTLDDFRQQILSFGQSQRKYVYS